MGSVSRSPSGRASSGPVIPPLSSARYDSCVLHDHDRNGRRWSGQCSGCLAPIHPPIEGTRAEAERELVEVRGWELEPPDFTYCVECARRRREVKQHDRRGRRVR